MGNPLTPDEALDVAGLGSDMPDPPDQDGGTIVENQTPGGLVIADEVQGPLSQKNPIQEINLFIGEFARVFRLTPMAALVRIQDILQAFSEQTYHAGGAQGLGPVARPPIIG